MKKYSFLLILGLLYSNCQVFSQVDSLDIKTFLNQEPDTIVRKSGDMYLQKDFTSYLTVFSSFTDTSKVLDEKERMWLSYLNQPHPGFETIQNYFKRYAEQYDVPMELMQAIAYVETNFTHLGPSIDYGWGMMHLVDNNYSTTLNDAAELIDKTPEELKNSPRLNIQGAAALLAYYGKQEEEYPQSLEEWYTPAKKISGLITDRLRELQARKYFEILRKGVEGKTLWGEAFRLPAHSKIDVSSKFKYDFNKGGKAVDYPGAIDELTSCNFSSRNGTNVDTYVNHYIGTGTVAGSISWFKNCDAEASAHFIIAEDGTIYQSVRTADKAWHCGATGYPNNARSVGVEHDATVTNPERWNSPDMLEASADLANSMCDMYNIRKERSYGPEGICGHDDMPGTNTSCPGPLPWNDWFAYLNDENNYTPEPLSPENMAMSVESPVRLEWDSEVEGSSFRVQVSTNVFNWDEEEGFSDTASVNETVQVNAGTKELHYLWEEGSEDSYSKPEKGRKYFWTVRGWESETGLTAYSQPQSFTIEERDGVTVIDNFEKDKGHFYTSPAFSGSTQGISSNSEIDQSQNMAYNGRGSLRLDLIDDSNISSDWQVRILSGAGDPDQNYEMTTEGAVTFWMATSTAHSSAEISVWLDDSDGIEEVSAQQVNNNGAWVKYSFPLESSNLEAITGNGQFDAEKITIDALLFRQSSTSEECMIYIDDLKHDRYYEATFNPVAEFNADQTTIFEGEAVDFKNISEHENSYNWTFEGGEPATSDKENPTVSYSTNGDYRVTLEVSNEDGNDKEVKEDFISVREKPDIPAVPAISFVEVTDENNNKVTWNKTDNPLIEHYNVYKETPSSDKYEKVSVVNSSEPGEYLDENSSPTQRAARYRISLTDTLGRETDLSKAHKTIHLTINQGLNDNYNLIWDGYEGINFNTYTIYRGNSKDNLQKIDQIQNTLFSYTDNPSADKPVFYGIGIERDIQKKSSFEMSSPISNIVEIVNKNNRLIYPNPATNKVFIRSSQLLGEEITVELYSNQGKLVKKIHLKGENEFSVADIDAGVYLVKMTGKTKTVTSKLIKQ
ncbi:MAG: N-acetylmuramoyl-L-alanine amidase [Bacteroidota bacterium]